MLCVVIRVAREAFAPIDQELPQFRLVLEPVVVHVYGIFVPLFDGVIGEARAGGVVNLDGSGCLGVSEFLKGGLDRHGLLCCHVGRYDIGLSGRAHDVSHYLAYNMERTVEKQGVAG